MASTDKGTRAPRENKAPGADTANGPDPGDGVVNPRGQHGSKLGYRVYSLIITTVVLTICVIGMFSHGCRLSSQGAVTRGWDILSHSGSTAFEFLVSADLFKTRQSAVAIDINYHYNYYHNIHNSTTKAGALRGGTVCPLSVVNNDDVVYSCVGATS